MSELSLNMSLKRECLVNEDMEKNDLLTHRSLKVQTKRSPYHDFRLIRTPIFYRPTFFAVASFETNN